MIMYDGGGEVTVELVLLTSETSRPRDRQGLDWRTSLTPPTWSVTLHSGLKTTEENK